ncbi:polysaccharide lyase family 1 protein, partial [Fimicolochytrium jonesii]|uniref:polysaccharide lyase family 1 protein n=1 Tax=Fimicolochytrium jonesii TaxID=1396493 RepID=UPI0022FF283B
EGFAFTNGLTTGGATGPTTHVSDLASLTAALSSTSPKTIILTGLLDLTAIRQLHINSHTTLLGSPTIPSGFTGGGLAITKNTTNVIVRNLHFTKPVGIDSIQIQQSSHVWIDHNTFSSDRDHGKDFYDGLLDITHAGDYITVSWNAFSDHFKVSLVGASDDDGDEDTGRLHVTYHHNHFHSVGSRTPSLRFGTGHVYNNLFEDMSSGVHSRMGARVLVENNIFANVTTPVFTTGSKVDGEVLERGNEFGEGKVEITKVAEGMTVPYGYVMDEVVDVRRRVLEGVGAGKLQF